MDKLSIRKPVSDDLGGTLQDLVTLKAAPPAILSASLVVILTGSILNALVTVGVTSLCAAFWTRLVSTQPQQQ